MRWIACELHTHTVHSDGGQSLIELARGAKSLGFDCIALTDHNTMSGLAGREAAERDAGIAIIPGMEWTTFFGHMVTIGAERFVDWRKARIDGLHECIDEVHAAGGLAGIAHPYRIGSPVCTGCHWEFEIRDWRSVDYIEVWSGTFPPVRKENHRAFALWTDRLNAGYRIAATSGRDWHTQAPTDDPIAVTYLGLNEEEFESSGIVRAALGALAAGRAAVTLGPLLTLYTAAAGACCRIGDTVPQLEPGEQFRLEIGISFSVRQGLWELPRQTYTLRLTGNNGPIADKQIGDSDTIYPFIVTAGGLTWARAELWGVVSGVRTLIAFTNAIYFAQGGEPR